jgi:Membrane protein of 12 TMs
VKFSQLWRLSAKVYKEVSFQSIFSLRSGSGLPQDSKRNVKQLVSNARVNTIISKLLTTVFIAAFAIIVFSPAIIGDSGPTMSLEVALPGSVSAFLTAVLFLIVFMGLQMSTSFVSTRIVDFLSPLPLSRSEISNIVFLCFVRIFDIPLVSAGIVFLAVYFLIGGSVVGGIISLMAIAVTEIFGLTFTIVSAKFFYSRVARAGGKSLWQAFLRLAFMLVWILPTFAAYFVLSFASQIVQFFAYLTQGYSTLSHLLVLIYPFSYGFLVSYASFFHSVDYVALIFASASCTAYVGIAAYCVKWVTRTVRDISTGTLVRGTREVVKDTFIKPQVPWLGILRKDLRIASRAPSFASLFLLPVTQTVAVAITFSSVSVVGINTVLGILTGISMITLLLPPTLLSIEGLASAYTRHLPFTKRTLITAKTLLVTLTFILSLIVLSIVSFALGRDFSLILIFGTIHAFSIAAAIMLELSLLLRKMWKEGFALGNIYSRISTYIVILIPGYIMAAVPMICALVVFFVAPFFVLPAFLIAAVAEFAIMTTVIVSWK